MKMASRRKQVLLAALLLQAVVITVSYIMEKEKSPDFLEREMLTECLMQLQLSELLRLQRSLERLPELTEEQAVGPKDNKKVNATADGSGVCDISKPNKNGTCVSPQALQLTAERRGYDYHPWQPEEKPSKLQTLFHVSITALAFLSFGGYLLCLIVQAIRSKGITYLHPVGTTMVTNGNGGFKKIKIYRRSRRRVPSTPQNKVSPSYENANHVYTDYLF